MKNNCKRFILLLLLILVVLGNANAAIDFWQYPEMAEKYSIFAGLYVASFYYDTSNWRDSGFSFSSPELFIDFMLPVGLPFSIGVSYRPFTSGVFEASVRPGYHINFDNPNIDFSLVFPFIIEFTDKEPIVFRYDFSACFRYRLFNSVACLSVEPAFISRNIFFGVTFKLN